MALCTNPVDNKNLSLLERWSAITGGTVLLAYGVKKRSVFGTMLATLGGNLVYQGTIGRSPLFKALGRASSEGDGSVSVPYRTGLRVDRSISIDKPREQLYAFWRNLDNLPLFMKNLHSVTPLSDTRSHWTADGPGGAIVEWDAEIIHDEPNALIGWRSLTGSDVASAGSVHFKPAPGGRGTEVMVELKYNPPGGPLGAALARLTGKDLASEIEEDLRRLKQLLETGEIATVAGQPTGKQAAVRREPSKARRHSRSRDKVQVASEDSFPASDAPSWTAPKELVS